MVLEALKVPSGVQMASGHKRKSMVTPVLSAVNIKQVSYSYVGVYTFTVLLFTDCVYIYGKLKLS